MAARLEPRERMLVAALLVGMTRVTVLFAGQVDTWEVLPETAPVRDDPSDAMTGEEIFAKLLEHNHLRETHLQQYSVLRTYLAKNHKGKVYAREVVRMEYRAPGTKTFVTTRAEGSGVVRSRVFKGLMDSEAEAAAGRSRRDSSISPANYTFRSVGYEDAENRHCLVVEAVPERRDKYLFEGKIWIDAQDFAVVRIAGHPAKNPSFWIKRAEFVRSYQKIGEFWLPSRDETNVEMKIFGEKALVIDHRDYAINRGEVFDAQAQKAASNGLTADFSGPATQMGRRETPKGWQ